MKKPLSLGVVSLFLGVSAISALTRSGSQERAANQRIQDRFIGAWRLAWLEEPDPDGNLHKVDCSGLLVYTPVCARRLRGLLRHLSDQRERSHITFHVEGALVRSLTGKDLSRLFELSGNQLIVKSSNPNEHWRVAWEHY